MNRPIYLDYAATTPVDPRVAELMIRYLTLEGDFGNASSQHIYGFAARDAVENAREKIAALIGAETSEIIFTSGATEADNLAIKGAAHLYHRKGKHLVTMKTEHKAVLDSCQTLEKTGYSVTYLAPENNGRLNLDLFRESLRDDTTLVTIMHVNNETGVMQDLAAIATETSARGILLHVDAAQSGGKLPLNVQDIPIDMIALSGHKIYGPKGIGALYLRKKPRVRVEPLIHGGGHEQGMRSGTLPVHLIVGMGEAFAIAAREREQDFAHVSKLNSQFLSALKNKITNLEVNGEHAERSPYILNLRFEGMLADAILKQVPEIAVSTASACQGKGTEGSYVLRAMGLTEQQAKSSIRVSFGRFTTLQDVERAASAIAKLF
ncbi:MAG TPA: aminotransferase class V-fold PLP-dependent enzyme [Gammaproteobacteria bacterium]|jgi:cysteine desulfurase|nr:aminotransferase class V-fold PLP-dependent enzyme [Gammaproteobacteria bacterium]